MWQLLYEQNMNGHSHHGWIYSRLLPNGSGYMQEFLNGVNQFDEFARKHTKYQNGGMYRCPCAKCRNRMYLTPDKVKMHWCIRVLWKDIGIAYTMNKWMKVHQWKRLIWYGFFICSSKWWNRWATIGWGRWKGWVGWWEWNRWSTGRYTFTWWWRRWWRWWWWE